MERKVMKVSYKQLSIDTPTEGTKNIKIMNYYHVKTL